MSWHRTDALGSVRHSADDNRVLEGIAVPYGVISGDTELTPGGEIVREAFAPASFRQSVAHWMSRSDGARMALRPAHGEKPVGAVTFLEDTPAGVSFRARVFDTPAGNEYLGQVREGLNGISIEAGLGRGPTRMKDGTILHRDGKLHALAGSISPAYDGARIALRDMEKIMTESKEDNPIPEPPEPEADKPQPAPAIEVVKRADAERDTVARAVGSAITVTRPELVYRPSRMAGGEFLRDAYLATKGDTAAAERQQRHHQHMTEIAVQAERAGDLLQSEIPGALPTDFLPGLLTPRILKGRPMGSFFNRFPIADSRPKTFAKVTTSTAVVVQSAEGAALGATDLATTAVTATPVMYGGYIDVSRQVLDSADPSATSMVMSDLIEAYAQASETVIKTAVEGGATASGTAITAATPFAGTLGNVIKYYTTRFKAAEAQFIPSALFAVLLAEADTTGRPKMPLLNPMNSDGTTATGGISGSILGSTTYLSYASTTNVVVTTRAADYVIYESSLASFSFDQVVGPQAVRIGVWAYLVVGTRLGGLSVTAA